MADDGQGGGEPDGIADATGGATIGPGGLTEEHRNAIGDLLQQVAERTGLPVGDLLGQVGLNASDVDQLGHGDLLQAAQYLMRNHPELVQEVAARVPALQGLIGLMGAGGGQQQQPDSLLGGLLGRVLGGS
jgi:hypothetical protein